MVSVMLSEVEASVSLKYKRGEILWQADNVR